MLGGRIFWGDLALAVKLHASGSMEGVFRFISFAAIIDGADLVAV